MTSAKTDVSAVVAAEPAHMLPSTSAAPRLGGPATAPVREPDTHVDETVQREGPWDVIVWDDPVNLMSYVVYVFRRIFGYSEPVARKLMLDVHHRGKALVASEPRENAELHVRELHAAGLQATMQRSL